MTKRADGRFQRNPQDFYATPPEAVLPLLPHLSSGTAFAEPCCGDMRLSDFLQERGMTCTYKGDLTYGADALTLSREDLKGAECIITNPPYTRPVMHALIKHFIELVPTTWLLLEFDWFATVQASPYVIACTDVVPIGRIKWIPESPSVGFDNYVWARFSMGPNYGYGPMLHPRKSVPPLHRPNEALDSWTRELNRDFIREALKDIQK